MNQKQLKNNISLAKSASENLLSLKADERKKVILDLAKLLIKEKESILKANKKDIFLAKKNNKPESFIERLTLDENRIISITESVRQIAQSPDILFKTINKTKRPSGIHIKKVIYPLGLISIIYESRPNVTIDAFALAFKSGNAVILKGGKEIQNTNGILVDLIRQVLKEFDINNNVIQDVSGIDKELSLELLRNQKIDCIVPRGGKGLIAYVKENAKIPVIITGASVVHTYVDCSADLNLAKKVIINAKTRRVSICNALDVLLLDRDIYKEFLKSIADDLDKKNVELRADEKSFSVLKNINYKKFKKATVKDFDTEFLDYILAIKVVNNFDEALNHIKIHSLGHSEAIITKNKLQAEIFFRKIDAACLYLNTSTQFSDGGEFGLGGEIGISTQKLHARGPFSYQELTTHKYLINSKGATRE